MTEWFFPCSLNPKLLVFRPLLTESLREGILVVVALLGMRECTVCSFQASVDGPVWAFVDTGEDC